MNAIRVASPKLCPVSDLEVRGISCEAIARYPAHYAREGVDARSATKLPQSGIRDIMKSDSVMTERLEPGE
jgi:hypothetical protein